MTSPLSHGYRFGPFELDDLRQRLLREGQPVPMTPKAFDLLLLLVQHRERVLPKEELMDRLWPGTFVDEANLTQQVFMLRKALGEQANGKPYIDTVPRRGYAFAAPVEEIGGPEAPAAVSRARAPFRLLVPVVVVAAVVVMTFLYLRSRREPAPADPDAIRTKTLVVLPFRALDSAPVDEFLALGMADAVITRLATVRGIVVRPTSAVLKYHESDDPLAAARKLRADALLDGRFQRAGDRIRVSVQLINVANGSSIWGERFDHTYPDVFALQDSIAERVASALSRSLTEQERESLRKRYTADMATYHLYLRGRYFWERRTADALKKSIDYYQQAIEADPAYALAYAGLADSYNVLGTVSDLPPTDAFPKAKAAAMKALEIDPGLWQAEVALAFATYLYDRDWAAAERGFNRALAHAPNYGPGHQWYAVCLASRKPDLAVKQIRRALDVDPLSLVINAVASWIFYLNRDFDAAVKAGETTIEMDPSFPLVHAYLGRTYAVLGRYEEAETELRKALGRGGPGVSQSLGMLGFVLSRTGRPDEAREILRDLRRPEKQKYAPAYIEALVLIGLGENDEALTMLERSAEEHYPWAIHYNVEPALDPLRAEPRFKALLQRLGLPELERQTPSSQPSKPSA